MRCKRCGIKLNVETVYEDAKGNEFCLDCFEESLPSMESLVRCEMEYVVKVDWQVKRISKVNPDGSIMIQNGSNRRDSRLLLKGRKKAQEIYTDSQGKIRSCPVILG